MKKARNRRRPHILPARWRKLEVRARKKGADTDSRQMSLQLEIDELESYIVGAGTTTRGKKAGGHQEAAPLPMRYDQRQAASRERAQLLLWVGILIAALAAISAWIAYRLTLL